MLSQAEHAGCTAKQRLRPLRGGGLGRGGGMMFMFSFLLLPLTFCMQKGGAG